jgi:hypothetical protein
MKQEDFSEMLRKNGFPACSKAAVSLAERPKETGVQFTPEARKTAQALLNSTPDGDKAVVAINDHRYGKVENRKNGRKTTVWLDDETRTWLETEAYLTDSCVGELIRMILRKAIENAASDAGTSEAAKVERTDCNGPAALAMTETIPSTSDNTRNKEENQA